MTLRELELLALQVRNHDGGAYRDKSLCRACLMEKAGITAPQDQMTFEQVWYGWFVKKMVRNGTCVGCGLAKEIMTLPATQ